MSGANPDPFAGGLIPPGASAPDATGRRKVHPLTPLVSAARMVPVLVVIGISVLRPAGSDAGGPRPLLGLLAAGAAVVLLVAGAGYLSWRNLSFWFDDDGDLRVDSGVLTRQQRRLQLSRLQSVDVVQPFVARLVGLAEVRVEVAGSGDSKAVLQFLTHAEAQALRNEIVARAAGLHHETGEAPEHVLVTVPPGELAVSLLMRGTTVLLLLVTVLVITVALLTEGPAGLLFLLVGGLPLFAVFSEFSRYYGFVIAESPDGLRLRHGLLQTAQQTVPPGRVQAVGFVQPLLWRRRDWVRVQLNVAGLARSAQGSGDQKYTENVLLPVAPWPVARAVASRVLPGVDLASMPLLPAPTRARRRSWIQARELGVAWDDRVFVARRGRLRRVWSVVPHARTQSVRVTQGPWERALRLATVHVDSTPGAVRIAALHQDEVVARRIAQEQADRAAAARAGDTSTRWAAASVDPQP